MYRRGSLGNAGRWVRVLAGAQVIALAMAVLMSGAAQAATADGWTAAYADAGNSSNNPGETVITPATAGRVQQAWTSSLRGPAHTAPAVVGGIAYGLMQSAGPQVADLITATSARTGALLWSLTLPVDGEYLEGLTVTGHIAVVPFDGYRHPGGVLAIDLQARRIMWSRFLPSATIPGDSNFNVGHAYTDGVRVYLTGSSNGINTWRLSNGAPLWTVPLTENQFGSYNGVNALALGNGFVFTSSDEGIVAYNATTGRRVWTAKGWDPIVAGGRVFALYGTATVVAYPAAGCGQSTCQPLWTNNSLSGLDVRNVAIAGADGSSMFLTYTRLLSPPRGSDQGSFLGVVARLSAPTGKVQWSVSTGRFMVGLVRGGGMIWMFNEYINGGGYIADRILGFSATATGATPSRVMPLPRDRWGFPQSLAVADGTLFEQTGIPGYLYGYRLHA